MKIMLAFTSLAPVGMLTAAPARAQQAKNIVDTAIAAGPFTTLANALTSADLVATLEGPGPFTVFAPTDEGFAKLPAGMLESLLKPEKKDKLRRILSVPAAGVVLSNVNMYDTSVVPALVPAAVCRSISPTGSRSRAASSSSGRVTPRISTVWPVPVWSRS
jgi:hypothetical protein